ncbi:MAG: type II toxin-antitoxin system VapC family toxin [Nitrososphaerota archaeon]
MGRRGIRLHKKLTRLENNPPDIRRLNKAASLTVEYSLDYEDALHLATALRNNAKEIVSNDRDFDKTPLKRRFS